jgi:phosphatidylglycerol:prolipoprotein diacylglycerol transferase
MIAYPHIDPIAFSLGPIKVHWYGIMYLVGFAAAWVLCLKRAAKPSSGWNSDQVGDLIFYGAMGVILGGRIGYCLFYNLPFYLHHPLHVFYVWDGGMSFHGGAAGVLLACWLFARKTGKGYFQVTDFMVPVVPIGLGAGRLGNFINAELWGKPTDVPWAMIFPTDPLQLPRHPSELYEFALEGVVLFLVLWIYSRKPRPAATVTGLFGVGYGLARIFVEFYREPDPQLGYLAFGWLTMGQVLSVPLVLAGLGLIWWGVKRHKTVGVSQA